MKQGIRKRIIVYGCLVLLLAAGWYGFRVFYKPDYGNLHPLIAAAKDGDIDRLDELLKQGTPIEYKGTFSASALVWAAYHGETDAVRFLLSREADIESKDMNERTALSWALENDHEDTALLLIEKGASLYTTDKHKGNMMHLAVDRSPRIWEALLKAGVDLEAKDVDGRTPLHVAAVFGDDDMTDWLLNKGAVIEARNKYLQTPLIEAASFGKISVMKVLLDHGADMELYAEENVYNALHLAIERGQEDSVRLLVERGANIQSLGYKGRSPLHTALYCKHVDIVRYLIHKKADLNVQDHKGRTLLYLALSNELDSLIPDLVRSETDLSQRYDRGNTALHIAIRKHSPHIKLLIKKGADVNARNDSWITPIMYAAQTGYHRDVRLLLEAGADSAIRDYGGRSALHLAARMRNAGTEQSPLRDYFQVVELLLKAGADIDARDSYNRSPYHYAVSGGNEKMMALLVQHGAKDETDSKIVPDYSH